MKKILGSFRVDEKTISNMKGAIVKYNSKNTIAISEAQFRRMALELLSQLILQDKDLPIVIKCD